jgi:hypothetical protein
LFGKKRSNPNELVDNIGELCRDSSLSIPADSCNQMSDFLTSSIDAKGVCALLQIVSDCVIVQYRYFVVVGVVVADVKLFPVFHSVILMPLSMRI